jgi:hypothetical protein
MWVVRGVFLFDKLGQKKLVSAGEVQPPQQEFLAPICRSLLLNEVLYPVTKEFSPDSSCLAQFFY